MLATTTESIILAAGGALTALIGGAFTFAGVIYNARSQRGRHLVKVDPALITRLRDELEHERELRHAVELDASHWRAAAIAALARPDLKD